MNFLLCFQLILSDAKHEHSVKNNNNNKKKDGDFLNLLLWKIHYGKKWKFALPAFEAWSLLGKYKKQCFCVSINMHENNSVGRSWCKFLSWFWSGVWDKVCTEEIQTLLFSLPDLTYNSSTT